MHTSCLCVNKDFKEQREDGIFVFAGRLVRLKGPQGIQPLSLARTIGHCLTTTTVSDILTSYPLSQYFQVVHVDRDRVLPSTVQVPGKDITNNKYGTRGVLHYYR